MCFIDGECFNQLERKENGSYEFCDSNESQVEWSYNKTSVCKIEGIYISKDESKPQYDCLICMPGLSSFNWTIKDSKCFIGAKCYHENEHNPSDNDDYCNPSVNQYGWTFNESLLIPEVHANLSPIHQTKMNVSAERLHFECVMDMKRLSYTHYSITWMLGENKSLVLQSTADRLQDLYLTEDHFGTLGTNITCVLQGKHGIADNTGSIFTSRPFFAGVVVTKSIDVQKGGSAMINYKLTVPFGCLTFRGRVLPCFIELNMLSPDFEDKEKCYGDIANLQHCRVKMWRYGWDQNRSFPIKHRGRQMYGVYPDKIALKLKTSSADHPLWDSTIIPEIQVNVHDNQVNWQQRVCSAYNAHITSFDGMHYEHQFDGVFTMYQNKKATRYMQVQVQLTPCDDTGNLYCICGVAVRAGGDVYVINFCNGRSLIQYMSCQQKLLHIVSGTKDNKKYKITFPSGTEVAVYIQYIQMQTFMNVEIRAADEDYGQTQGLCGSLNDKCSDDLTKSDGTVVSLKNGCNNIMSESKEFSKSWSVEDDSRLFSLTRGKKIDLWTDHEEYCSCPSSEVSDKFECSARSTVPCNWENNFKTIGQTTCILSEEFVTTVNVSLLQTTKKPDDSNMTFSIAESHCMKEIENNTAFRKCAEVPNMPNDYFINICAIEVKRSNSFEWIRHTMDSLKSRCLSEVQKNETLSAPPEEGTLSITESVVMAICPGLPECNGNGRCEHGSCVCNEGYMSDDCSKTKDTPPEIYGIRGKGICDRNELNCDTAFVVGNRIDESDELSCKLSKYVIHPDGTKSDEGTTIVSGNLETLVEVHCPLVTPKRKREAPTNKKIPFVIAYDVSVGYNTQDFSDAERVYIMNTKCQGQNGTLSDPVFVLKDNTCFIDNQCFNHEERHPEQPALYCDALASLYQWTFDASRYCKLEEKIYQKNEVMLGKKCLLCNPSITSYNWTLSDSLCFIEGQCYKHEEKNKIDECLLCDATINPYKWSKPKEVCITKIVTSTDDEESSSNLGVILLCSIGSVVLLFIVGFIINCYIRNKNNRAKRKGGKYYDGGHMHEMPKR